MNILSVANRPNNSTTHNLHNSMSANECLTQVTDVIVRYERMVERLRTAGRLPRNPKEKEEVGMLLNEVLFFEIM
jgi:hypothetical protein